MLCCSFYCHLNQKALMIFIVSALLLICDPGEARTYFVTISYSRILNDLFYKLHRFCRISTAVLCNDLQMLYIPKIMKFN